MTGRRGFSDLVAKLPRERQARIGRLAKKMREDMDLAQLREARCSLLAAGLIAYESPLYQVLSLEPTSTSEPPVARTGQTLSISAILRQMLETGGAQQPPPSP